MLREVSMRYLEGREDTGRAQGSINVVLKDRSAQHRGVDG